MHKSNGVAAHSWKILKQMVDGGETALQSQQKTRNDYQIFEKHSVLVCEI